MAGPIVRKRVQFSIIAFQDPTYDMIRLGEIPSINTPDEVPIVFHLLKLVQNGFIYNEDDEEPLERDLDLEIMQWSVYEVIRDLGLFHLRQQSSRNQLRDRFIDILSNKFHLPEEQHQIAVDKIFRQVDSDYTRPLFPIVVHVEDYTARLRLHTPEEKKQSLEEVGMDNEEVKKEETCSICINEFDAAAPIARLPSCFHVFHRDFILRWLVRKPSCPICRCPSQKKKRKLDEIISASTPTGPRSSILRIVTS